MLTRKGARRLTSMLDSVASVVQENPDILGVNPKIAADFAYRCDLLSDAIETRAVKNFPRTASENEADDEEEGGIKTANSTLSQTSTFDPSTIGEETDGPLESLDSDEPWMTDHFTQLRFDELGEAVGGKKIGPQPFISPVAKQAGLDAADRGLRLLQAAGPSRGFSDKSKLETFEIESVGANLVQQVKTLTDLNLKVEANRAKLRALAGSLLEETEAAEAEAKKAQAALVDAASEQLTKQGNYIVKAKDGLLEVTAMLQVVEKRRTVDAAFKELIVAAANKYGDDVAQFISTTLDALRDQNKPLSVAFKGTEMLARTAGLADAMARFKDFLKKSLDRIVSVFVSATEIIGKQFRSVEGSRKELLSVLAKGKTASKKANWLTEE